MAVENVEETVTGLLQNEILVDYPDLFVVNVAFKGNTGSGKLLVEVDGDAGITIEQCGKISRGLGKLLEDRETIKGKYILEVASPGADKPLLLLRQYGKHVGRRLKISKTDGLEVEGKLLSVSEDSIQLETKSKKEVGEVHLAFAEVSKSNVIVSFK